MKKILSVIISVCLLFALVPTVSAEAYIELDPLQYEEYMRGETVFISGNTNVSVVLGIYYPQEVGGTLKYSMIYSPSELAEGIEILIGESDDWFYGVWTIVVQSGDVSEVLEFTLSEYVDRSEEEPETQAPTKKPSSNKDVQTVVPITPDKTKVTLTAGETEKINITTSASSLSLEIEDESVVSASLSGKTLTVTALKKGTSTIWVKTSNNYANINVTVEAKAEVEATAPTEEVTETPTEAPTEEVTEAPTEAPTEPKDENPFTDLKDDHWAKDSILSLYQKGIINGMDAHTFAPDDYVTRAQFVTMLTKAFNLKMANANSPFNDVNEDDWFFSGVMAAYANGIAQGDYNGNFNPNSLVTRQDMAVLSYRAGVNSGMMFSITSITTFSDHSFIKDYAVEAVYSMKSAGIINGMTSDTFEPMGNATRAQAAHIIAKLLESISL